MKEYFKEFVVVSLGGLMTYRLDIIGAGILFGAFFTLDFVTGCMASFCKGEEIVSYKLRWSFVKTACYLGTFSLTLFIGVCFQKLDVVFPFLKIELYAATYIECLSILENLLTIYPQNLYLKWLHYMLSAKWVKWIVGMKKMMKEHKTTIK